MGSRYRASVRALVVSNMAASRERPGRGVFVRDQVAALRARGDVDVELFEFLPGALCPRNRLERSAFVQSSVLFPPWAAMKICECLIRRCHYRSAANASNRFLFGAAWGEAWNRDGIIVFAPRLNSGLFRISDAGGRATADTQLDRARAAHVAAVPARRRPFPVSNGQPDPTNTGI